MDLLSFTGSDSVGKAIMAQSASTLKKLHLELGGKSAMVVRADADLQKAAAMAAFSFTMHAGQGCALLTRYLVHNSSGRLLSVEMVKAIASSLKLGNPADPSVIVGTDPRSRAQEDRRVRSDWPRRRCKLVLAAGVRQASTRASSTNRRCLTMPQPLTHRAGGRSSAPSGLVTGFDTDDEAVALANDSRFGLNGGVMSANPAAAYRIALRLRTGGVAINGGTGDLFFAGAVWWLQARASGALPPSVNQFMARRRSPTLSADHTAPGAGALPVSGLLAPESHGEFERRLDERQHQGKFFIR